MKHKVRINGEIKELDCELGSGIYDKHGREIFEGDVVKRYVNKRGRTLSEEKVIFERGTLSSVRYGARRPLKDGYYFEIVGHSDD